MLELYVDGGCSGNGQRDLTLRRMIAVVTLADGAVVHEETASGGSNNIAELMAVEAAYRYAVQREAGAVTVYTDSRNNLSWARGRPPGKGINDRPRVLALQARIADLCRQVSPQLVWVPRERNVAGHYIEARYSV